MSVTKWHSRQRTQPAQGRGGGSRSLWMEWGVRKEEGCRQRLQTSGSLSYPLGRDCPALGPSLGWTAVVGSLPRTCQPPLALPFPLNFLPETRGRGDDSRAAALRCILIQHRVPAGCPLAARISGDVWSCCWLEREVGEIIMSPWEEIWAQAEASFFQLWEKRCLLSILPQTGAGWGRVFNPFLLNALCKINPQVNNA